MAVALAAGHPVVSGVLIPELWVTETLDKMYAKAVTQNFCSTEYEGELKKHGDVVHILLEPTVTRKTGKIGQDMVSTVTQFADTDLTIDKYFYYDQTVHGVVEAQSDAKIVNILQNVIAKNDAEATDKDILAGIATGGGAANVGATAGVKSSSYNLGTVGASKVITSLTAVDNLLDMFAALRETNASENLWGYIPSWYARLLKSSELNQANVMGDDKSIIRTGLLGMLDGIELYETNNFTAVTDGTDSNTCYYAQAGHRSAISFAKTIQNSRIIDTEDQFAKRIQVEVVYGYDVVNPDYLATLYCRKG